ncbi:B-box domain protein [Actinidia chinensis var. chinensis]|uniref:B-box domain protein n=1 Tax=Actinidia chinensis var. chinensis TaxID=1590841 RepID=A0A2R6QWY2_ACTCC|nr:B-box domain protein [Actinidia chinensis var. chinensis]
MKGCELCSYPARIFCEADRASLCSDCDQKVHSANFLVAKHSRCLLCHVCQSPTTWKASGTKLGPTVSVCENCVDNCSHKQGRGEERKEEGHGRNGDDETDDDFGSEDDDCSDEENEDGEMDEASDDDEEEDGGDNQVVPWSSVPPPPPVASSSISKEVSSSASKRTREAADLDSEDEIGSISSRFNHNIASMATSSQALENDEANFSNSRTSLKLRRPNESIQSEGDKDHDKLGSRSVAMMVSSLKKLQRNTISDDDEASAIVLGICRLSRDPTEF